MMPDRQHAWGGVVKNKGTIIDMASAYFYVKDYVIQ
jgi:hypothetical protein